jgi:glycosyltransferase involved in cell wall biosynthesis
MYARADGIVALSHRARAQIAALPSVAARRTPVVVVPSTVDLDRFRSHECRPASREDVRLVYVGSIGFRYLFERIAAFASVAREDLGRVRLSVLTHADRATAEATLRSSGLPASAWSLGRVPHSTMPGQLVQHDAGLFFLTQGLSEHGCSPTKIGEYWACGLPVVSTPNVSDTDDIIQKERVGVIVHEHSPEGYRAAARDLSALLRDAQVSQRCRQAAETHYALGPACERQLTLYRELAA